jgi:hypothetical protein
MGRNQNILDNIVKYRLPPKIIAESPFKPRTEDRDILSRKRGTADPPSSAREEVEVDEFILRLWASASTARAGTGREEIEDRTLEARHYSFITIIFVEKYKSYRNWPAKCTIALKICQGVEDEMCSRDWCEEGRFTSSTSLPGTHLAPYNPLHTAHLCLLCSRPHLTVDDKPSIATNSSNSYPSLLILFLHETK